MKSQIKTQLQTVRAILNAIPVKGEDVIRLGYSMQTLDNVMAEVDKLEEPVEVEDNGG